MHCEHSHETLSILKGKIIKVASVTVNRQKHITMAQGKPYGLVYKSYWIILSIRGSIYTSHTLNRNPDL